MTSRLSELDVFRVDIVDRAAVRDPEDTTQPEKFLLWKSESVEKADWSAKFINDLPDSSFAYVESDGEKDEDGKTTPRSLRHYPYKDASGSVDLPHLRNGLSRAAAAVNAGGEEAAIAQKALPKLQAAAKENGVGESSKKETPVSDITQKLATVLSKAAQNESALDSFIAKDEFTPEMAAAVKGAFRLLSTTKASLTPEAVIEMAKAMGVEIVKDGSGMSSEMNFGTDKDGNKLKPHAFEAKDQPDGTCAKDGFGGGHAIHMVSSAGASGSRTVEAAAKAEETEPTEEVLKSELAKLPEAVRASLEKAMATAKAEKERADAAEKETVEKREQIAKAEVVGIVKAEMTHVPGIAEEALTELLYSMRKADAKTFDTLRPVLKAASEAIATGAVLAEMGSSHEGPTGDPNAQAVEIAKGIAKAEGMSIHKAKAEAWKRNPELQRQYQAEQAARQAAQ